LHVQREKGQLPITVADLFTLGKQVYHKEESEGHKRMMLPLHKTLELVVS